MPPVATTREAVEMRVPSSRSTVKRWPSRAMALTPRPNDRVAPAAFISSVSMRMICLALSSQNSWPRVFSCQAMPWRSTILRKSCWVNRFSADRAKRGFSLRKLAPLVPRLVKLQRPPPEMRIFSPGARAWSITRTRRPRLPASMAHIMPAAPTPTIRTSSSEDFMSWP
ncbi:hypothetical protein D3C81_1352970 [compost metagenome]